MMYLPDSNIFIGAFSSSGPEKPFLQKIIKTKKLRISAVVAAEFLAKTSQQDEEVFNRLMEEFPVLVVDKEIAKVAAEYRKQFLRKTKRIFLLDCFLAAQAKVHHLTLVTNNKADFPMRDIKVVTL